MRNLLSRREMLQVSGGVVGAAWLATDRSAAVEDDASHGYVIGEPTADKVGTKILQDGGNAVDAIVAAALTAAVCSPGKTGIGGYGGSAMFAVDGGRRIVSLDFNTAAPAAMRSDTFRPGTDGKVPGRVNETGWMSAGVPGILAGLQLALDKFGTRKFAELASPAIKIARDGFPFPKNLADAVKAGAAQFELDPGSRKLLFPDGKPLAAGESYRNPEIADLLSTLAQRGSVESFYRGDIAAQIADAIQKNGGLLTKQDLATYRANLAEPLALNAKGLTLHTAPLTAGGLSVLQALATLVALRWDELPIGVSKTHGRIEALRLAWRDRLTLLGDPAAVKNIPSDRLLSAEYATASAEQVAATVKAGKLIEHPVKANGQAGTIHLSAVDRHGNMAALTLSHGNTFGARVTVDGLGLTLGHGMYRFDPRPEHPNAPGPGKRPLHNMCPTIVTRDGRAVLAIGGRGGRRIPNALFEVLTQYVLLGRSLAEAIAAPRMHTEGDATIEFEKTWPLNELDALRKIGYTVKTAASATLSATRNDGGQLGAVTR